MQAAFFSVISHKVNIIAFIDTHSFEWCSLKMCRVYQMKAKDTLLFNNIITQHSVLAKRAWFWHVTSQCCVF